MPHAGKRQHDDTAAAGGTNRTEMSLTHMKKCEDFVQPSRRGSASQRRGAGPKQGVKHPRKAGDEKEKAGKAKDICVWDLITPQQPHSNHTQAGAPNR